MTAAFSILFAVMLLTSPDERHVDAASAAARSREADRGVAQGASAQAIAKAAKITSRSCDFDRKEGVILFEGNVSVHYSDDCRMDSDRLYMFLAGSNELQRVVALGNVLITNDLRVGTCEMATYRRKKSEIEMFGDGKGKLAKLVELGKGASSLSGTRIRFWLDTEQVEVEDSRISVRQEGVKSPL